MKGVLYYLKGKAIVHGFWLKISQNESFTFYLKGKAIVHGFWLKISRNEKFYFYSKVRL